MEDAGFAVSEGTRVVLNFSLALEDGSEIDSNFDEEPVSFVIGDGSLLPGFERKLFGLLAGDAQTFVLSADEAFGQPREENLQRLPRDQFQADSEVEVGMVYLFNDAGGSEVPGTILEVNEDWVNVDFNHPLAGRTIVFRVKIDRVEVAELH